MARPAMSVAVTSSAIVAFSALSSERSFSSLRFRSQQYPIVSASRIATSDSMTSAIPLLILRRLLESLGGLENGHGGARSSDRTRNLDGDLFGGASHRSLCHQKFAAAQFDEAVRLHVEHQRVADIEIENALQRHQAYIQHGLDLDLGAPDIGRKMPFPGRVAAELLAHEALKQDVADGFDRRVRQKESERAAPVLHIDRELDQDRGIGRARDGGEARIGFQPVNVEVHRRERLEGLLG